MSQLTADHPTSGRDFFSTHFDINYLPENQDRTEALWETSENGGRAAYDGERRVTFVAQLRQRVRLEQFNHKDVFEILELLENGSAESEIVNVISRGAAIWHKPR